MLVEVQIRQTTTGAVRVLEFSRSPIRLGRNQLNDIPLDDPFVSEWHGIIRADDGQVAYFDLGSTNGTALDGRRLAKNVPVLLTDVSRLSIGTVTMSVVLRGQPAQAGGSSSSPLERSSPSLTTGKTMGWGTAQPRIPPRASDHGSGQRSSPFLESPPAVEALPSSQSHSGYANYPPTPPPNLPGATPFPPPDRPPPFRPGSHETGAVSGPTATPVGSPDLVARQAQFIEAFGEAFVGLRKGYEQFGAEVGVRTLNGATPLHRARSAREVLDYLMHAKTDPNAAVRDLIATFADFGIHHIALMEGITQGVRAVLQSVDPRSSKVDPTSKRWNAAKAKEQWQDYLDRFDLLLTDDDELHAAIFSDVFACAYASVTVGDNNGNGGKTR